jgi:predicted metalloprotease with PDZ domain
MPATPVPFDRPFVGTVVLAIDATDTDHQVFNVHEKIPVQAPGPVTLLYPEWETGSHAPTASVADLAGLVIGADGHRLTWHRDPIDVHAFHLEVPPGTTAINADFQFLAPPSSALIRPDMIDLPWHRALLYPAGWYVRDIPVAARLTLPHGLHLFTALAQQQVDGDTVAFELTTLESLVDAPVYAGRYWRQFDLAAGAAAPVYLDIVADAAGSLAVTGEALAKLRALVVQTGKVFGPGPYRRYDAIVSLSDELRPGGGIEHLEEGENNLPAAFFIDRTSQLNNLDLIAHEYVHSWNGRLHQPADLWSPNFNLPVQGSLLWVYEGQTEFWGRVLTARAGLRSRQETLDKLALDAALVANRAGRAWKSLEDSTNDAIYMAGHPTVWHDWQRREDYYAEGVLLWLDVDARLRERSGGRFGLDAFAHRFFAAHVPNSPTVTYTFEDICAGLNVVVPDDWGAFLRKHLDTDLDTDALAGLTRAGWQLAYTAAPSATFRQDEVDAGVRNLDYSIGLQVRENGVVRSVAWGGLAFKAGFAPGVRITAVNGRPFTPSVLEAAVNAGAATPLVMKVHVNGQNSILRIDYHGGLRYPRLERISGVPDRLGALLAAS